MRVLGPHEDQHDNPSVMLPEAEAVMEDTLEEISHFRLDSETHWARWDHCNFSLSKKIILPMVTQALLITVPPPLVGSIRTSCILFTLEICLPIVFIL